MPEQMPVPRGEATLQILPKGLPPNDAVSPRKQLRQDRADLVSPLLRAEEPDAPGRGERPDAFGGECSHACNVLVWRAFVRLAAVSVVHADVVRRVLCDQVDYVAPAVHLCSERERRESAAPHNIPLPYLPKRRRPSLAGRFCRVSAGETSKLCHSPQALCGVPTSDDHAFEGFHRAYTT